MVRNSVRCHRGLGRILATPCIVVLLGYMSCGGGGSPEAGPVPSAGFSLSSTALSFADQGVGSTSSPLSVSLTNVGNATLVISNVQVTGSDPADFTLTNHCGSSLPASAQCTITASFSPSAAGKRTASVVFTDNAASSPQALSLDGTGTAPGLSLSAATLTFGSQIVGTTSAPQTLTLTNDGNAALSISSLELTGADPDDFPETTTCGTTVPAAGSCTVRVTFRPTASGSRTASVSISDNASGGLKAVSITGTGMPSVGLSLSPSNLSFGSQAVGTTSAAEIVTLTNTGSGALSVSSIAMTGANPADFAETGNTCGSSLAPGGACTVEVTFTPSIAGARTATLSFTDNAGGSPQTVGLTGTGIPDVILNWGASPSSGVMGYDVYRGTASGGESTTPLNSTPIEGTTYVDDTVTPGTTYYYILRSIGPNGVESAPSNEATATVPGS